MDSRTPRDKTQTGQMGGGVRGRPEPTQGTSKLARRGARPVVRRLVALFGEDRRRALSTARRERPTDSMNDSTARTRPVATTATVVAGQAGVSVPMQELPVHTIQSVTPT